MTLWIPERDDGRNSLAAVHPELLAEWNAEANAPLRADRIKATYDKAVRRRCRDGASHSSYKMSPFARAKREVGCPICRRKRWREPQERQAMAAA